MLRDIRDLTDRRDEYAAELRRRWGGLLSYRYIGRQYDSMDPRDVGNTVIVRHDMRNPSGGLLFAVLGISAPESGHMSDLEAVPNPVIHSCQIIDPGHDVTRIEIVSEELKRGRQMGYSRAKIVDANRPERTLALIEGQGVAIGVPPEGLEKMEVDNIEVVDSPDLPPLWQVFGGYRHEGIWMLPELTEDVASPDAALHIGPQFVILETAAAHAAGTDVQGVSAHVMFMARGKSGPFRAETETLDGPEGTVAVRVLLHDEGNADKVITSASYTFRRTA